MHVFIKHAADLGHKVVQAHKAGQPGAEGAALFFLQAADVFHNGLERGCGGGQGAALPDLLMRGVKTQPLSGVIARAKLRYAGRNKITKAGFSPRLFQLRKAGPKPRP